jgi:hypothetical protein
LGFLLYAKTRIVVVFLQQAHYTISHR